MFSLLYDFLLLAEKAMRLAAEEQYVMIGAVLPRLLDEVRLHLGSQDARGSAAFSLFSIKE